MIGLKITSISIIDREFDEGDKRLLAFVTVEFGGLRVRGFRLERTEKRGISIYPPRIEGKTNELRSIEIIDSSLRHKIMSAALDAYRLLGGAYGEWEPRANEGVK